MWAYALKILEVLGWALAFLMALGTVLCIVAFMVILLEDSSRWLRSYRSSSRRWPVSKLSEDLSESERPYSLPPRLSWLPLLSVIGGSVLMLAALFVLYVAFR